MKTASQGLIALYLRVWPRLVLADSPSLLALALVADGFSVLTGHRSLKDPS